MDLGKDLKNLLLAGIGAVAVTAEKSLFSLINAPHSATGTTKAK